MLAHTMMDSPVFLLFIAMALAPLAFIVGIGLSVLGVHMRRSRLAKTGLIMVIVSAVPTVVCFWIFGPPWYWY